MGTLRDEVYEQLDYLSRLTEIVLSPHNELLSSLPDRVELSKADIVKHSGMAYGFGPYGSLSIDPRKFLQDLVPQKKWRVLEDIADCFTFEIHNLSLDFEADTMTGSAALVKTQSQLDEKEVLELAVHDSTRHLMFGTWVTKRMKERTVTVLNTLEAGAGDKWVKTIEGRVAYAAHDIIKKTLENIILENKWRIREYSVITKIGEWVHEYMSDEQGTSLGLVNLTKLKIMVDKDMPIYSIDEVKSV